MNEEFLHAALEALKEEILSSLHCALPGTVQSFDPAAQTVSVSPSRITRGRTTASSVWAGTRFIQSASCLNMESGA